MNMKTSILSILVTLALAAPASAQLGQFPPSQAYNAPMAQRQINQARVNYAYATGYDGLAPSWQNPNAYYISNGLGVVPAWATAYPYGGGGCYNGPVIINAPAYNGCGGGYPYPPVYGGNGGGWGVNIGVGFGGTW